MSLSPSPAAAAQKAAQFFILRSVPADAFHDEVLGRILSAVHAEKVNVDEYQRGPLRARLASPGEEIIHGRRVNDAVELFPGEDGKTTPGLREQLVEMGLQVSLYRPVAPPGGAGDDAALASAPPTDADRLLEKVITATYNRIKLLEQEERVEIDYAILAEKKGRNRTREKTITVTKMRLAEYRQWMRDAVEIEAAGGRPHLISNAVECRIFAAVEKGEVVWMHPLEVDVMAFFKEVKGTSMYHVNMVFNNEAARKEEEEQAALKKLKREAKKERREAAAVANPKTPAELEAEAEASQSRRRDRAKAKKKAQKERKRAEAEAAAAAGAEETRKRPKYLKIYRRYSDGSFGLDQTAKDDDTTLSFILRNAGAQVIRRTFDGSGVPESVVLPPLRTAQPRDQSAGPGELLIDLTHLPDEDDDIFIPTPDRPIDPNDAESDGEDFTEELRRRQRINAKGKGRATEPTDKAEGGQNSHNDGEENTTLTETTQVGNGIRVVVYETEEDRRRAIEAAKAHGPVLSYHAEHSADRSSKL